MSIQNKRIHFIGIGGIGMSGIAHLCLKKGYHVSGSDINKSENTNKLKKEGAYIFIGHDRVNINNQDLAVYSSAIKANNPEIQEAIKKKIPIIKRAEFLAMLMKNQIVIAVTGAHGKTTTSSLASHLLNLSGFAPTIAVGGIVANISNNAKLGTGKFFVAEADESDGTFLFYKQKYSIVTNIDREHLDYYKTFTKVKDAFKKFILNTQKDGCVIWCCDDRNLVEIVSLTKRNNISFGLDSKADIFAADIEIGSFGSSFNVFYHKKILGRFCLSIPGKHNISNALSVIALGIKLGIKVDLINRAIKSFQGVKRRFQKKYDSNDIIVVDDYAHHPTEIQATLSAAKTLCKSRVMTVFQLHRYSRTKYLLNQFSKSFSDTDYLFLTDLYSAGEKKIKGVNAKKLYLLMKNLRFPKTRFVKKSNISNEIARVLKKGDMALFLGAGDINKVSDEVVKELKRKNKT